LSTHTAASVGIVVLAQEAIQRLKTVLPGSSRLFRGLKSCCTTAARNSGLEIGAALQQQIIQGLKLVLLVSGAWLVMLQNYC
jgi:hypothetical protein